MRQHEEISMEMSKVANNPCQRRRLAQPAFAGEQQRDFSRTESEVDQALVEFLPPEVDSGTDLHESLVQVALGIERIDDVRRFRQVQLFANGFPDPLLDLKAEKL